MPATGMRTTNVSPQNKKPRIVFPASYSKQEPITGEPGADPMNINQRGASMTRGNCLIATRRLSLGAAVLAVSVFSTCFVDAAIIAQLRPDFDNAAHVNEQSSGDADIADTLGTGTWRFYASITENPTDGGAGLFDLEYTTSAVSNRTANAYIHTAASQALGLPGISSGQLIDSAGQGTPASNEVAVHPGNQSDTTTKEF